MIPQLPDPDHVNEGSQKISVASVIEHDILPVLLSIGFYTGKVACNVQK